MAKPLNAEDSIVLLREVYDAIEADVADEEVSFAGNGRLTYCLYSRASEIFVSIIALLDADLSTTATMLLRPLCETFAFLRASIQDEEFSAKYLKKAFEERKSWAEKALIADFEKLGVEKETLLNLQAKTEEELKELALDLQSTKRLLMHSEPVMYFHIFSPASLYLHSNAHSMSMYFDDNNSAIPTDQRDDSGRYRHVTLSAASVFIKIYDLICDKQNRKIRLTEAMNSKVETLAGLYKAHS